MSTISIQDREVPDVFQTRALSTFNNLQSSEKVQVLDTIERISKLPIQSWSAHEARRLKGEEPEYLITVNKDLFLIARIEDAKHPIVLDFVRPETLEMFRSPLNAQ